MEGFRNPKSCYFIKFGLGAGWHGEHVALVVIRDAHYAVGFLTNLPPNGLPEGRGVPVFNPHAYTIEEGGMKAVDQVQLAFKRQADPDGLLNPGKMLAWDDPEYDGRDSVRLF